MLKKQPTFKQKLADRVDSLTRAVTLLMQNKYPTVLIKSVDGTPPLELAYSGDSGYDLYAREVEAASGTYVEGITYYRIKTGVSLNMPPGLEAQVRNRSSSLSNGYTVQFGTIDSGYRGEIVVLMTCSGARPDKGEKIAQLVFNHVVHPSFRAVDELGTSERGEKCEGSSDL
jgi:dUTP pyrophosphatase